jgi:hypothetical protein
MKNMINDQKRAVRVAANSNSLPPNQNSKIRPLSLTPCFSNVDHTLTGPSTVSTVSLPCGTSGLKFQIFEISNWSSVSANAGFQGF